MDGRPESEVPLQLDSPRYVAMQRHFDTIGPAGRRMMRRTASTQVCLDWWPGRAGLEQWRVLNLAGPHLAAAYARSVGLGSRLSTWLAVDPDRTAFDDRLLPDDAPVAAYAPGSVSSSACHAASSKYDDTSPAFCPCRSWCQTTNSRKIRRTSSRSSPDSASRTCIGTSWRAGAGGARRFRAALP